MRTKGERLATFRGWGGAALVTGASSGIGLELARLLAARQINLVLVARSADNLRILAQKLSAAHRIQAIAVPLDLTDPELPEKLPETFRGIDLEIDLLVNNAGFAVYGPFGNQGAAREAEMIRLNTLAPAVLAAMFLPGMLRRKRGVILNVASTAGFQPLPYFTGYAATKAHLISWSRGLDRELRGSGVRCLVSCPGTAATNFHRVSGAANHQKHPLPQQSAVHVAEGILRGLDRGKPLIVTGLLNRLHATAAGLLPASWKAAMGGVVMRPKRGL
jgi:short-subunit dehydrogenase